MGVVADVLSVEETLIEDDVLEVPVLSSVSEDDVDEMDMSSSESDENIWPSRGWWGRSVLRGRRDSMTSRAVSDPAQKKGGDSHHPI